MNFATVVTRGLWRRPVRTLLTLLGIAAGIAAVVALVGIARGFDRSWDDALQKRRTDIVVSNLARAMTPKPFDEAVNKEVQAVPGVAETCMLMVELAGVEDATMIISAREWGGFSWQNITPQQGRLPRDAKEQAVVLGKTAAEVLHKKPGDKLQLEAGELEVVGVVDGGAFIENGSVILSLAVYQEITGNEGRINTIDVRAKEGLSRAEKEKLCSDINTHVPQARARMADENLNGIQGFQIAKAMSWGTSLLAVLVGVLGVMNTMLMTVFERKQELSVLMALGWRRSRIVRLILFESAILGLLGGALGVVLGAVGVNLLVKAPAIKGLLQPDIGIMLLLTSVGISVAVGVLSGLYPAWRSSRLAPAQALQG